MGGQEEEGEKEGWVQAPLTRSALWGTGARSCIGGREAGSDGCRCAVALLQKDRWVWGGGEEEGSRKQPSGV